ncbi:hypothetical protein L596_021733 [Steinernema carpocapsae]|uniref:K Homology domain-containing protein n=1 Tax=Steinernema carpocapsae TaxID=34508 RepID=A0A4U5MKF7_STECR|nr:hypothetical protein L596_021733 [Steinernema carpocapsae]
MKNERLMLQIASCVFAVCLVLVFPVSFFVAYLVTTENFTRPKNDAVYLDRAHKMDEKFLDHFNYFLSAKKDLLYVLSHHLSAQESLARTIHPEYRTELALKLLHDELETNANSARLTKVVGRVLESIGSRWTLKMEHYLANYMSSVTHRSPDGEALKQILDSSNREVTMVKETLHNASIFADEKIEAYWTKYKASHFPGISQTCLDPFPLEDTIVNILESVLYFKGTCRARYQKTYWTEDEVKMLSAWTYLFVVCVVFGAFGLGYGVDLGPIYTPPFSLRIDYIDHLYKCSDFICPSSVPLIMLKKGASGEHDGSQVLKLTSSQIGRVIGRSGANINAIRDATNASIDIQKLSTREDGRRTVTVRGGRKAVGKAVGIIELMLKDHDANVETVITRVLEGPTPSRRSSSSSSSDVNYDSDDAFLTVKQPKKSTRNAATSPIHTPPRSPSPPPTTSRPVPVPAMNPSPLEIPSPMMSDASDPVDPFNTFAFGAPSPPQQNFDFWSGEMPRIPPIGTRSNATPKFPENISRAMRPTPSQSSVSTSDSHVDPFGSAFNFGMWGVEMPRLPRHFGLPSNSPFHTDVIGLENSPNPFDAFDFQNFPTHHASLGRYREELDRIWGVKRNTYPANPWNS